MRGAAVAGAERGGGVNVAEGIGEHTWEGGAKLPGVPIFIGKIVCPGELRIGLMPLHGSMILSMSESRPTIRCPGCGVRYHWKPPLAGRKFRCARCRATFRLPFEPDGPIELIEPPDPAAIALTQPTPQHEIGPHSAPFQGDAPEAEHATEQDSYAFDDPHADTPGPASTARTTSATAIPPGRCPQCGSRVAEGAVLCLNCGYHLERGEKLRTSIAVASDDIDPPSSQGSAFSQVNPTPTHLPLRTRGVSEVGVDAERDSGTEAAIYERRVRYEEQVRAEVDAQHRRETFIIPIVLSQIGMLLILLNAFWLKPWAMEQTWSIFSGPPPTRLQVASAELTAMALQIAAQIPCVLFALVLIARLFSTAFGTLGAAVRKIIALLLLSDGIFMSLGYGLDILTGGWGIVGFHFQLAITFGVFLWLCTWLLEMEYMEAVILFVAAFVAPILLLLILLPTLQAAFF